MWPFKRKQPVSQITSGVGHVYDIVSQKDDIYTVADTKTKKVVGYIGRAWFASVRANGPLTPYKNMAIVLAYNCARNRYLARQRLSGQHSKTR